MSDKDIVVVSWLVMIAMSLLMWAGIVVSIIYLVVYFAHQMQ